MAANKSLPLLLVLLLFGLTVFNPSYAADRLELQLKLQKVTDNVYAIVGEMGNRTPDNLGNNATFGVVVTTAGVVLIDPGGTYQGAEKIHEVIQSITDKPIAVVINTGGQDHRWLGNGYFKNLGARLIASKEAVEDQKARTQDHFFMLGNLVGEKGLRGTNEVYADNVFDQDLQFTLGDTRFELHHAGPAHTPGDSFVWLPEQKVMFTGDIVYTERMLGVIDVSDSKSWIKVYEAMAAYMPAYLVPGHGHPTTLEKANADTYDYLRYLRQSITEFIDNGGDIAEISRIDQSRFKYLLNFELLAGRNAQKVYTELEWE
jgi:glyoxylase-like metal-dependent hydrolase (beta-lactamase superfamily II)